jgi:hypothetical protein
VYVSEYFWQQNEEDEQEQKEQPLLSYHSEGEEAEDVRPPIEAYEDILIP